MAEYEPEVAAALRKMTESLIEAHPEAKEVIDLLNSGGITAEAAMARLLPFISPEALEAAAQEAFKPLRAEAAQEQAELVVKTGNAPVPLAGTAVPWLYQPPEGLARLNPLYEAAIIERVQFDGDLLEARTGALPSGHAPAVPVSTDARNPVAIGVMLEQASAEVMEDVRQLRVDASEEAVEVFEQDTTLPVPERAYQALQTVEHAPEPEGYRRGTTPALRTVSGPTGGALARLTDEERGLAAWKSISTTQGRRSALQALYGLVGDALMGTGLSFKLGGQHVVAKLGEGEAILSVARWTTSLQGGAEATQPMFSYIDTAGRVLAQRLDEKLDDREVPMRLDIMAVNTVDIREVGWAARLVRTA